MARLTHIVHTEDIRQGCEEIDAGGQRVADARRQTGRRHQHRDMGDGLIERRARLAEDILLTKVMTVIGTQDHQGVVPQVTVV